MDDIKIDFFERSMEGQKIRCIIAGVRVDDAMITYQRGNFYICNNVKNGRYVVDLKGYKYAWSVAGGSRIALNNNEVRDIFLLGERTNPKCRCDMCNPIKFRMRKKVGGKAGVKKRALGMRMEESLARSTSTDYGRVPPPELEPEIPCDSENMPF